MTRMRMQIWVMRAVAQKTFPLWVMRAVPQKTFPQGFC